MHEMGLAQDLVAAALRRSAGRRVLRAKVHVGTRHRVDQASMEQAFTLVAQGTDLEDATLEVVVVPAISTCRSCDARIEAPDLLMACTECGGLDLALSGGDELVLESIELAPPSQSRAS
jgi:hydrogenase nickel incorporation protein HypA/HybF